MKQIDNLSVYKLLGYVILGIGAIALVIVTVAYTLFLPTLG